MRKASQATKEFKHYASRHYDRIKPYPVEIGENLRRQARAEGNKIAAKLEALADAHGMTPSGVARHQHLLATIGLEPEDLTHGMIMRADQIQRDASVELQQFVLRFNRVYAPDTVLAAVAPKFSPVVKLLARLAGDLDLPPAKLRARPKLLASHGLEPDDLDDNIVSQTEQLLALKKE